MLIVQAYNNHHGLFVIMIIHLQLGYLLSLNLSFLTRIIKTMLFALKYIL